LDRHSESVGAEAGGGMDVMVDGRLAPLRHEPAPLRNQIMRALRRAIELGHLAPGRRLIEKDLCEQLDVSRTSLREALRELQAEGVLTQTANRGLTVVRVSRQDAENIYRIRSVLEPLIVEQFIERADAEDVAELRRRRDALTTAYRSGNLAEIVSAKRAFYDRICTGAQNPIAFDILTRLTLLTSPLRSRSLMRPERQRQSIREIDALVEAIEKRQTGAARRAAETHVRNAARSGFLGAGDFFPQEPRKP
jgi:DNA-binding GntR family transcriptional regulator